MVFVNGGFPGEPRGGGGGPCPEKGRLATPLPVAGLMVRGFGGADRTLRQAKQHNRNKQALREVYAKLDVLLCLLVS